MEEEAKIGFIEPVEIDHEMRTAYIDYSMSVIVSRALPDARDGLKPVQRRVLFGMQGLGLNYGGQTKKSARIVGEVLGKFHPHGDSSVYDAMARLAQNWNQRYPLVYGQGNFGSMDGDPVAAMRYTEAKLEKLTEEVLGDLDKNTVDMTLNFGLHRRAYSASDKGSAPVAQRIQRYCSRYGHEYGTSQSRRVL